MSLFIALSSFPLVLALLSISFFNYDDGPIAPPLTSPPLLVSYKHHSYFLSFSHSVSSSTHADFSLYYLIIFPVHPTID